MVGAGHSRFIDALYDRINGALNGSMTLFKARLAIDNARRKMYGEDITLVGKNNDEPHFTFLIALWSRKDGFQLLSGTSDAPTSIVEDDRYVAIGTGAPLANCLVKTFYSLDGTCEEAALISTMALKLVKRFVPGCGGGTNIIAVMQGALARPRSVRARKEVEDRFLGFFRSSRISLRKFVRCHCQNPLLVRRFPREEKTRHISQG
jgi:hypothetical protein